ncbi:hypothetical protein SNE40_001111 [Patella caerulea]|uniref:Uncharacterized protein n=1 Tax=Patella caerulea TaxID=87958 RepID=A0AAN8K6I3_PATCE
MNNISLNKTTRKLSAKRLLQYGALVAVAYFAFQIFDTIMKNRKAGQFYDGFSDEIGNDDVNQNQNQNQNQDQNPNQKENNNDFDFGANQFEAKDAGINNDVHKIAAKERERAKEEKLLKDKQKQDHAEMADNVDELNKLIEEEAKEKQKLKQKQRVKTVDEELDDIKDDDDVVEQMKNGKNKKPVKISNGPKDRRPGFDSGDDSPEVAKEKQRRRKVFFEKMEELNEEFDEDAESNMHEHVDMLYFVSAAWSKTFQDVVNLVVSIQYHYGAADIIIFDLGLTKEQSEWLSSVCQVEVRLSLIEVWPPHIRDLERGLWRPVILQMALAGLSHMIWIEPHLVITKRKINAYIDHSRKRGVVIAGQRQKYSTYVVTHPDMYYYLSSDVRKLMRVPHIEISMIIIHNTRTVRQRLMKWLLACAVEEWCVAPTGSKRECDTHLKPNSRYYANCHRYDESAINILLKSWMKYDLDKFSLRDVVTARNDGRDSREKARICHSGRQAGDL